MNWLSNWYSEVDRYEIPATFRGGRVVASWLDLKKSKEVQRQAYYLRRMYVRNRDREKE